MTLEAVNVLIHGRQRYVFVILIFYLAQNATLQEIVFVATLVTCQQFPHSPNLFNGCGAHGVWPTKYLSSVAMVFACSFTRVFSARDI